MNCLHRIPVNKYLFYSRYFQTGRENESSEELQDTYKHWHHQLADYFEHCTDNNRKTEVLPFMSKVKLTAFSFFMLTETLCYS